jgi:2-keto-3-deoxy-L-fuconate dehydrogenase
MPLLGEAVRGRRVLVTQATEFMLVDPGAPAELVAAAGAVDVLVANLSIPAPSTPAGDVTDDEWRTVFAHLVDPLPRLVRAVLPQMLARGSGKIVVMGSASALRGMRRTSTYSAARGAQVSYVRAVGTELAASGVQVNLIAQNFVESETYFPPEVQALPAFQERLRREVPAQRLGTPREDALLAVFLASDDCRFMVGQSIPFAGGWVT